MIETILDIIHKLADRICEDGVQLLGKFSGMHPVNSPYDSITVISVCGNQYWNNLPSEGKQIQTQLLPEIDRLTELVYAVSQNLPSTSQQKLKDLLKQIKSAVEQNSETWWKTNDEAVKGFRELIEKLITTLQDYYGDSSDDVIAIPDTNAFLSNPDIEHWQFRKMQTILL